MEPGGRKHRDRRWPLPAWAGIAATTWAVARILHPGREPGGSVDHRPARSARADSVRAGFTPAASGAGGAPAAADAHTHRSATGTDGHLCRHRAGIGSEWF